MGRIRLIAAVLIGLLTLVFILNAPTKETASLHPTSGNKEFLIGAMSDGYEPDYSKLTETLHFNMWHRYIEGGFENGELNIHGWTQGDELNTIKNENITDVQNIIGNNNAHGMRTLMERPKIMRLAFGERSDYQCESAHLNPDLWFYSYSGHGTGRDIYDDDPNYGSSSYVRYCGKNAAGGAGWVVSGLKANREQVNMNDRWEGDKSYGWIVKPRIRADRNFVNNPANLNSPVCRIDVLNYDSVLIKSTVIRARNLLDTNGNYDGRYKEDGFNFSHLLHDSTLTFPQSQAVNFNPRSAAWYAPEGECHVDFRVYWYGSCDMWIDYVRVDNDIADKLFKDYWDDPNHPEMQWIKWEAENAGKYKSSPYKFYLEEFEFNNIPCMSYLSRHLRNYNPGIGLMCDMNWANYNTMIPFSSWEHMMDKWVNVKHVKRYLIDSVGSSEIFMGAYPFGGNPQGSNPYDYSLVPETLPCGPQDYDEDKGMLAHTVSPQAFDDWLQTHLDQTAHQYWSYRLWSARADSLSKMAEIPYINIIQAHLWWSPGHLLSEPTNEEMELMSNLAVTYGARGIFYFWYGGWGCVPRAGNITYRRGLTDPVTCDSIANNYTLEPRTRNVYRQNKWQKIININQSLQLLGPALMSFNNSDRHSYIYRLDDERIALVTDTYFRWLVTGKPGTQQESCPHGSEPLPPAETGLVYDCTQNTYLQAAVFKKPETQNELYFMIVNRRCSPFIDSTGDVKNGGRRKVKVIFDADNPQMSAANKWKITDVGKPGWEIIFDKTANQYTDLGWFMPAEGRLYKMVPAD